MDDSHPQHEHPTAALEPIDEPLLAELPTFELFFKTFGFKRIHGRIWGLLVLAGKPLSSREICEQLSISQGAVSTTLNELAEWGAISDADLDLLCRVDSAEHGFEELKKHLLAHHMAPQTAQEAKAPGIAKTRG